MPRLSLDDSRWLEMGTRSPTRQPVAAILRHLLEVPDDIEAFEDLWPHLCSEDTAWPAAYAALPYILDAAEALTPKRREEHLYFAGYVAMCTAADKTPADLRDEYDKALDRALALYPATLMELLEPIHIRHALAAIAALKRQWELGELIDNLDCGCPYCGKDLLPR